MRFLISIFIVLILLSGCSNKNEQLISVQKHIIGKDYSFVAYKEPIENNKALRVVETLNKVKWEKYKLDVDKVGYPDYIFYFNNQKKGNKIVVYSLWSNPARGKFVTKDNGSKYVQLNKNESEIIFETITSFNPKLN